MWGTRRDSRGGAEGGGMSGEEEAGGKKGGVSARDWRRGKGAAERVRRPAFHGARINYTKPRRCYASARE